MTDTAVVPRDSGRPPASKPVVDEPLAHQLLAKAEAEGVELLGPEGLLSQVTKAVLERELAEEMTEHLGYERHDPAGRGSGNSRNGTTSKRLLTEVGPVELAVPRDRAGSFDPRIVRKGQSRLDGFNDRIIALYARGMTTRRCPMSALRESVWRHRHELWVDNLRVVLIAGVIVVHTATAYVVDIPWYYDDERAASGLWAVVIGLPTFLAGAFGLGPLFLVAGMFSARSVGRRGPAGFIRSRLVRLGVPLLVFVLLIQPLTDWVGNRRSERGSFLHYLGMTEVSVMWFVASLLVFSLGYAGLRLLRPARPKRRQLHPLRLLAAAAATVAVTSLAVWQVWPWNAEVVLNLRVGEWPQAAVLFALGVSASETGWPEELTRATIRRIGWVAAAAAATLSGLFGVEVMTRGDVDVLLEA